MGNQYSRTADNSIYSQERRYDTPKESFKQIGQLLKLKDQPSTKSLLDIGCATGEFLYYVRTENNSISLCGAEYSENLVSDCRQFLEKFEIDITEGDANDLKSIEDNSFDFVTTIGVTSIFDDFRPSFSEMIRVCKNNGTCLNHMLVNEMDVDVIIKYINPKTNTLESGWNKFSINSISKFLSDHPNVKRFDFIKHELPFKLEKKDDLLRSWTNEINGKNVLWNGLNMEISLYHIVFEIKK